MIGRWSAQGSLFGAQVHYLDLVGADSFYGFAAEHGRELFRHEGSAALYCADNGRPSVPPSLLFVALLLQSHVQVCGARIVKHCDERLTSELTNLGTQSDMGNPGWGSLRVAGSLRRLRQHCRQARGITGTAAPARGALAPSRVKRP